MEHLCGDPDSWHRVRRHWIETGVLHADSSYTVGGASKRYRLGDDLGSRPFEMVEVKDPRLAGKLGALLESRRQQQTPLVRMTSDAARGVMIDDDDDAVRQHTYLATPEGRKKHWRHKKDIRTASVLRMAIGLANHGEHGFTQDQLGRLHSVFTRVPREIRKGALRFHGEPLIEVDISSCQPLIVGYLAGMDHAGHIPVAMQRRFGGIPPEARKRQARRARIAGATATTHPNPRPTTKPHSIPPHNCARKNAGCLTISGALKISTPGLGGLLKPIDGGSLPPDLRDWIELCESGGLYDEMAQLAGRAGLDNDQIKALVFKTILFGAPPRPGSRNRTVYLKFKDRFPTVCRYLGRMKAPGPGLRRARGRYERWFLDKWAKGRPARISQRVESHLVLYVAVMRLRLLYPAMPIVTCHDSILTHDEVRVLVEECGAPTECAKFFTREEAAAWVVRELGRCRRRPKGARPGRGSGDRRRLLVEPRAC
jgi:hypothetical protein